jgi:hypothetical protein
MTEFGLTPFFTAQEFEAMGDRMVIWSVSGLRVANKATAELHAAIARVGGTHRMIDRMQTRAELYETIGLHTYEALDAAIVQTIVPTDMPRRDGPRGSGQTQIFMAAKYLEATVRTCSSASNLLRMSSFIANWVPPQIAYREGDHIV